MPFDSRYESLAEALASQREEEEDIVDFLPEFRSDILRFETNRTNLTSDFARDLALDTKRITDSSEDIMSQIRDLETDRNNPLAAIMEPFVSLFNPEQSFRGRASRIEAANLRRDSIVSGLAGKEKVHLANLDRVTAQENKTRSKMFIERLESELVGQDVQQYKAFLTEAASLPEEQFQELLAATPEADRPYLAERRQAYHREIEEERVRYATSTISKLSQAEIHALQQAGGSEEFPMGLVESEHRRRSINALAVSAAVTENLASTNQLLESDTRLERAKLQLKRERRLEKGAPEREALVDKMNQLAYDSAKFEFDYEREANPTKKALLESNLTQSINAETIQAYEISRLPKRTKEEDTSLQLLVNRLEDYPQTQSLLNFKVQQAEVSLEASRLALKQAQNRGDIDLERLELAVESDRLGLRALRSGVDIGPERFDIYSSVIANDVQRPELMPYLRNFFYQEFYGQIDKATRGQRVNAFLDEMGLEGNAARVVRSKMATELQNADDTKARVDKEREIVRRDSSQAVTDSAIIALESLPKDAFLELYQQGMRTGLIQLPGTTISIPISHVKSYTDSIINDARASSLGTSQIETAKDSIISMVGQISHMHDIGVPGENEGLIELLDRVSNAPGVRGPEQEIWKGIKNTATKLDNDLRYLKPQDLAQEYQTLQQQVANAVEARRATVTGQYSNPEAQRAAADFTMTGRVNTLTGAEALIIEALGSPLSTGNILIDSAHYAANAAWVSAQKNMASEEASSGQDVVRNLANATEEAMVRRRRALGDFLQKPQTKMDMESALIGQAVGMATMSAVDQWIANNAEPGSPNADLIEEIIPIRDNLPAVLAAFDSHLRFSQKRNTIFHSLQMTLEKHLQDRLESTWRSYRATNPTSAAYNRFLFNNKGKQFSTYMAMNAVQNQFQGAIEPDRSLGAFADAIGDRLKGLFSIQPEDTLQPSPEFGEGTIQGVRPSFIPGIYTVRPPEEREGQ